MAMAMAQEISSIGCYSGAGGAWQKWQWQWQWRP